MDEEQNIQPMQSDFEQIKKTDADGKDFWSARELSTAMGYYNLFIHYSHFVVKHIMPEI